MTLLLQAPRSGAAGGAVILFPAIDLKDGVCVRLVRGDMASAMVFNRDPAAQAQDFAEAGFSWLHVVDLDGALAGRSLNGATVAAIRNAVGLRIQLGGGIRDRAAIDHWLALGVDRVVLGTAALRDPELVREAAADHPGKIVVGILDRCQRGRAVDARSELIEAVALIVLRPVGIARPEHQYKRLLRALKIGSTTFVVISTK